MSNHLSHMHTKYFTYPSKQPGAWNHLRLSLCCAMRHICIRTSFASALVSLIDSGIQPLPHTQGITILRTKSEYTESANGMHLPEFTAVGMLGFAMRSGVTRTTPKDAEHRQVRSRSLEGASTRSAQRDRLDVGTRVQSPGYTASQNPSREACQQQQRTQQQRLGTQKND